MFKRIAIIAICLSGLLMTGCTDAGIGKITSVGDSAHVSCYSGGKLIYDGYSTGKVESDFSSDGYYFKDRETGKMLEVSGDCIIIYDE